MSDIPKRPWFRFHLLTAVLMMVVAGGVSLANMREYERASYFYRHRALMIGWPLGFREHPTWDSVDVTWSKMHLAEDMAVALAIIAAVALVSEFIIRCREVRTP
jgi:hypothetical protein